MGSGERIRTYPIRGLVIFFLISFLVSTGMIVLMAFLSDEIMVIRVVVWIFCSIFTIASGIMLLQQLTCYVEVTDNFFIKHVLFTKTKYSYKRIDKITNNDGWYDIYVEGKKASSFVASSKEAQQIILFIEKKGVKVDW